MSVLNAFTVDVEDYFQVSAFERNVPRASWSSHESRVVRSTHRLLDLAARHDVQGTFFILGWVAQQAPQLVRDIDAAGHVIGSHSHWHRLLYAMQPAEFREDLARSRDVLQDIIGKPVTSYRAPSFSVTKRSLWAIDILADEGFRYDSSIYPVHHDRYGIPNARQEIHSLETTSGRIWEFPPAVYRKGPLRLPVSGGGYFRLYPYRFSRHCLRQINRRGQPFVFYVHPWEVDPDQPRLQVGSRLSQWRHHVNVGGTIDKLDLLLRDFRFGTMEQVVDQVVTAGSVPATNPTEPSPSSEGPAPPPRSL